MRLNHSSANSLSAASDLNYVCVCTDLLGKDMDFTKPSKCTTVIGGNDDRKGCASFPGNVLLYLKVKAVDAEIIGILQDFVNQQEYDTDAMDEDLKDKHSNIKLLMDGDGIFALISTYFTQNIGKYRLIMKYDSDKPFYSFGMRFYYWDFFKDNSNEQNIVYREDRRDKARMQRDCVRTEWWDRGNKGYVCSEWYIPAKYNDIADEILNNEIATLSMSVFKSDVKKAEMKLKLRESKKKTANVYFEGVYGIAKDSPIALNHVLALLLYNNNTELCSEFSATFRRTVSSESDGEMKARHSNYHFFGKYLREFVEVFGEEYCDLNHATLYHGISIEMFFQDCNPKICGPMSTTTCKSVALKELDTIFS